MFSTAGLVQAYVDTCAMVDTGAAEEEVTCQAVGIVPLAHAREHGGPKLQVKLQSEAGHKPWWCTLCGLDLTAKQANAHWVKHVKGLHSRPDGLNLLQEEVTRKFGACTPADSCACACPCCK